MLLLLLTGGTLAAQRVLQTCVDGSVALSGPVAAVTFDWSPGRTLDRTNSQRVIASPTRSTTYYLASRKLVGDNLILNPSFEQGKTGYRSEYVNGVVARGKQFSSEVDDCPDAKDLDNGDIMAVRGDLSEGGKVWCQNVRVKPGSSYLFNARVASLSQGNPARLRVAFDGELVDGVLGAEPQTCLWRGIGSGAVWTNERDAATVEVCLVNAKTSGESGYTFAIDDLFLGELDEPSLDSFRVELNPKITTDLKVRLCPGERFTARGIDLGPGESGTFELRAVGGCDSIINVTTVAIDTTPATRVVNGLCLGESVDFRGLDIASDTTICITTTTEYGCEDTRCTTFLFLGPDAVSIGARAPSCYGDSTGALQARPLAGVAPFAFTWSDSARGATRENLPAGTYGLVIEDANGCKAEAATVLGQPDPIRGEDFLVVDARCADEPSGYVSYLGPGGTPPYLLEAKRNAISFDPSALPGGTYALTVTDANGCTFEGEQRIGAPEPPSVEIVGPTFIRLVDEPRYSLRVTPGDGVVRLSFSGQPIDPTLGRTAFDFKPEAPGDLVASVTDQIGCSVSDTLSLSIQSIDQPFFPTAFSPNGDERNDLFTVVPDPAIQSVLSLQIFDRWGNILYSVGDCGPESLPDGCGWNGTSADGADANVGVYTYFAQLQLTDGRELQRAGEVSLLR